MHKKELKNQLSDSIQIPKDVCMGLTYLTILGDQELFIENHRGIVEYHENLIRIMTKNGRLHISGNKLNIVYYANEEIKIEGNIAHIEFISGGKRC